MQTQTGFGGSAVFAAPTATQEAKIGAQVAFEDGRLFRYVYAPSTIAATRMVAMVPNEHAIAATKIAAAGIGAKQIVLSNDCSGIVADEYKDGWFFVTESTGSGQQALQIKSHGAGLSTGITLDLYQPLRIAIAATGTVAKLISSKYYAPIIAAAADPTVVCALGMSMGAFSSTNCYGWIQTAGTCAALADADTIVAGSPVILSENTAGAVGDARTATVVAAPQVGVGIVAAASTKYGLIELRGLDTRSAAL